jgi:hypothetical protein
MENATLARPKAKTQQPTTTPGPKPTALTIRGSSAWREWVERGAKFCRTDIAKLVDKALIEHLKAQGFKEEPPER